MLRASMVVAFPQPRLVAVRAASNRRPQKSIVPKKTKNNSKQKPPKITKEKGFGTNKKEPVWQCVQNCGACCKLDKGPSFPSPEEIFEDPSDVQLFTSLVGPDGWCIHYDKDVRTCSIYDERPYFCRVEPGIFDALYGIDKKSFNKEACSACVDTIKAVYGTGSKELEKFNHAIWCSEKLEMDNDMETGKAERSSYVDSGGEI